MYVLTRFQIVWEVILPAPAEVWLGEMEGVQLRHVKTGKLLAVTKEKYPQGDWGEGMSEVVVGAQNPVDANKWKIGFHRLPRYSKFKHYFYGFQCLS